MSLILSRTSVMIHNKKKLIQPLLPKSRSSNKFRCAKLAQKIQSAELACIFECVREPVSLDFNAPIWGHAAGQSLREDFFAETLIWKTTRPQLSAWPAAQLPKQGSLA